MSAGLLPTRYVVLFGGLFGSIVACHTPGERDPDPRQLGEQSQTENIARLRVRPEPRACPSDMVTVRGQFCPKVEQRCLEHHPEFTENPDASERCTRFAQSVCRSEKRERMSFCIDRFEWPNQTSQKPRVLTSWTTASKLCAERGKRLCTEQEWVFACEGQAMLPYTYGYVRDPTRCVLDRLYVAPRQPLKPWEICRSDAKCLTEFTRLDQRERSGTFPKCHSPFGVFDMNGNVNEWVSVKNAVYPKRSGLKGGWWGPVRDRCRPTVRFHKEDDFGYEVGFRCCADLTQNPSLTEH